MRCCAATVPAPTRASTHCGEVVSVGLGRETKLIKTDAVCVGEGLTQAFRAALGRTSTGRTDRTTYSAI